MRQAKRNAIVRHTISDTARHSGIDKPEKPAADGVADHQGPRFESRGQLFPEVSDPSAQPVEIRPVER